MYDIKQESVLCSSGGGARAKYSLKKRMWKWIIDHFLTPFIRAVYHTPFQRWVGGTMIVLTHAGRKTGKIRKTVLYAQHYDPRTRELKLVAAFGVTDWFLNISRRPALLVQVGETTYVPEQKVLSVQEIAEMERRFRQQHPLVARVQAWLMDWPWRCSEEEFLAFAASLRGVVLWPKPSSSPAQ